MRLLIGARFARGRAQIAQGCLTLAGVLSASLAFAAGLSLYAAAAAALTAAVVLAWILVAIRRDPQVRPFSQLFAGDRWVVTTAALAPPLAVIVGLETAFANVVASSPVGAAERWFGSIIFFAPFTWLAVYLLSILAKPRMRGSVEQHRRVATVFVLAELTVDGIFILILEGGAYLPWMRTFVLAEQGLALEAWSSGRQVGGLGAAALMLNCMGLVEVRLVAVLAVTSLLAAVAAKQLPSSIAFLEPVPVWLAGVIGTASLLDRVGGQGALRRWRVDRLAGAVLIGAIPVVVGAAFHVMVADPWVTRTVPTILALMVLWPTARWLYPDLWRPRRHTSTDYAWGTSGNRWIWALVPFLWSFFCISYSFGSADFSLDYLLIPVAAWLGARHGEIGWRVLTVGTLPQLVMIGFGHFTIGANPPALFIALQVICRLFGQRDYQLDCLRADRMTKRQKLYMFVVLAVYIDWVGSVGWVNLGPIGTQLSLYVSLIFLMLGMSKIPLRSFVAPFACIAVLSFLATSFYMPDLTIGFARIGGFKIGLIYAGYFHRSTSFALECLLMYFVGTVIRARLAQRQALPSSTIVLLSVLTLLVYTSAGLAISYEIITEDGTWFGPTLEFGTSLGGAALLFVAGAASGAWGALLAIAAWCLANLGIPYALDKVFLPGAGLIDSWSLYQAEYRAVELTILADFGSSLVGTNLKVGPGWAIGPVDLLFAAFGWRVHRALLRQPEERATEEVAIARAGAHRCGLPTDLPSLRVCYMDRFWIWPTGLVVAYGAINALVALAFLVPAPFVLVYSLFFDW
jgi:hypothetical protein